MPLETVDGDPMRFVRTRTAIRIAGKAADVVPVRDLRPGQHFVLLEPDGRSVVNGAVFTVSGDPYVDRATGFWAVPIRGRPDAVSVAAGAGETDST